MKALFNNEDVDVHVKKYENGRKALTLTANGMPMATASVNIPNIIVQDDEVLIKDYSENKGILKSLTDANIVKPINVFVIGFESVTLCKVLI